MTIEDAVDYIKQAHKHAKETADNSGCVFTQNYYAGQVGGLKACLMLLEDTKEGRRVFKTLTGIDVKIESEVKQ